MIRYKDIADSLRSTADSLRKNSKGYTESRHDEAESELDAAKLDKREKTDGLNVRIAELKRVQDSGYLQHNATGEKSRVSADPDNADVIQAQSRKAWAEQISPSNASNSGVK